MKHTTFRLLLVCLLLLLINPLALAKTLLFVPADDRPVSFEYAAATVQAAHMDILTPPASYLSGLNREGNPEDLWYWVQAEAGKADALVLSADALLYGGLVDSRTHEYGPATLEWRLKRFARLKAANPDTPIYVFSTILRSPQASAGALEPRYFVRFGPDIYQYAALQEKGELEGLTHSEEWRLAALEKAIPPEVMTDWLDRRDKNFRNNHQLIELTKSNIFAYLILGRDDTSYYSRSHKEGRMLNKLAANLPDSKYLSFPGADQLGMVLLARAYNELLGIVPTVAVHYALGPEASTIPRYEDQPFGQTIASHIIAAGGKPVDFASKADLVLAVNTPLTAVTEEAESVDNFPVITDFTRQFVSLIENNVSAGKSVAVADIAFANGSDNSLLAQMERRNILDKISAYSGWNTASNTLGYAIGQGMMAATMKDQHRKNLLAVRYLDDWAWQANIRPEAFRALPSPEASNIRYLSHPTTEVESLTQDKLRSFAKQHLWVSPESIFVTFPWDRLFEIGVTLNPQNK